MSTQALPLKGPITRSSSVGRSDEALPNLTLSATRPLGYTEAEAPTKGWVTWGHVGNRVPTNIAASFALATGKKVWVEMTTNGAHPIQVISCVIGSGADVPADSGGTEMTPPTTMHYLLGQVSGAGTTESPFTLHSSGSGNLRLETYAVGTACQLYDPGPPIVPASVKTTYATRVVRVV